MELSNSFQSEAHQKSVNFISGFVLIQIYRFSFLSRVFLCPRTGDETYSKQNGSNSNALTNSLNSSSNNTNVPSSQSVQQQIGHNSSNSLVPHSQSAYEIGHVSLTPLAQHQQALHQQLQQRFASVNNSNSGEFKFYRTYIEQQHTLEFELRKYLHTPTNRRACTPIGGKSLLNFVQLYFLPL